MTNMGTNIDLGDGPRASSTGNAVSSIFSSADTPKKGPLPPEKKTESSTSSKSAQKTGAALEESIEESQDVADSYSDSESDAYDSEYEKSGSDDEGLLSGSAERRNEL